MNYSVLDLRDNSWFQQKRLFDPVLRSMQSDIEKRILELMEDAEVTSLDNRMTSKRHKKTLISIPDLLELQDDGQYFANDIKSGAGLIGENEEEGIDGKQKKHYAVQLAVYSDILIRMGYSKKRKG
jgi:hypothetical protein